MTALNSDDREFFAAMTSEKSPRRATQDVYASNPEPQYPRMSRRFHEEGKVVLKVLISSDGKVLNLEVLHSSGFERLDSSALETVKSWIFRLGAEKLADESWVIVPVNFKLNT
ncbi:MAG: energy transducer TonB [Oligoflexus sp.]|nr:energy transducer TonB [Oligoflexus sp.]